MGRGGKFPWRQAGRQGLHQCLLVGFDGQRVITPALEENLLRRFDLRVERVGQRRPVGQGHFEQEFPGGRDFVAAGLDGYAAQPATAAVHGADQFDVCVTQRLAVHDHQ